jgi:serine protease Do
MARSRGTGTIPAVGTVMKATGFSLVLAAALAVVSSIVGTSNSVAQPPAAPVSATSFRDIARRENPVVVSVTTRSRVRGRGEGSKDFRFSEGDPPDLGQRVHLAAGTGFVISTTGDILTNNHVVEGAERIDVSLFGNERKRYRAIRVGSDPLTDSALIRLQNPPPNLQAATLGDSSVLESGDWVMAIGNPFQLGHSVTVGVVSFPQRPFQVRDGRWRDMIQIDASINQGNSGGPLFNVRGEVVGINVAMLDADTDTNVGIGFAVPINTVKALLPQLRQGKVVRGQLGVQLHGGPILEDEATELRLPRATGAIVMSVDDGSAAERAGLRAGDVIVEIDGRPVADTRDLLWRTAYTAPGTRVTVKIFRDGNEQTRTAIIEEQPDDAVEEAPPDDSDGDDGLTLGEITSGPSHLAVASAVGSVRVMKVAPGSPADDAELLVGDIVWAINGRQVHTLADARRELRGIDRGRPVFLLVWRRGTRVFLEMRKS